MAHRVSIGDICDVVGGGTPARDVAAYYGGTIPWVTPKDMKRWEIRESQINITQSGLENSATRLVPPNSVLIVVRSGVLKHTIPVAISRAPVAINQDMKALLCSERVHPDYVARFIKERSPIILQWVRATTADNFPIDKLKALAIPLPPLSEQRRIAAILDKADELRAKRRAAIAKLDSLTQSIFLDLFGDPVVNTHLWPLKALTDLGTVERGVSKRRPRNSPELLGGPYPFVQTGDVANCDGYIRTHSATYSEIGLRQSRLWRAGTLCITIAANIAKTGILTFDACFPDSVVGFRAEERATVEFVRVWLTFLQKTLEKSAPESAQKNINLEILRALAVPTPGIELQQEFTRRIDAIERCKIASRRAIDGYNALFASLQHRAFRGEL